jgi:hypothetical protein
MDNDFFAYIARLESMAFFVGYPLIYAIVQAIGGRRRETTTSFIGSLAKLLPFAYALSATLFIGLLLKELYPDYSLKNISQQFQFPFLKIWGMLALLFWIPAFNKRPVLSLLHSLVFFFFLLKDLYLQLSSHPGREMLKNDMKIYTDSLLLNAFTFAITILVCYLFNKIRNNRKTSAR